MCTENTDLLFVRLEHRSSIPCRGNKFTVFNSQEGDKPFIQEYLTGALGKIPAAVRRPILTSSNFFKLIRIISNKNIFSHIAISMTLRRDKTKGVKGRKFCRLQVTFFVLFTRARTDSLLRRAIAVCPIVRRRQSQGVVWRKKRKCPRKTSRA